MLHPPPLRGRPGAWLSSQGQAWDQEAGLPILWDSQSLWVMLLEPRSTLLGGEVGKNLPNR